MLHPRPPPQSPPVELRLSERTRVEAVRAAVYKVVDQGASRVTLVPSAADTGLVLGDAARACKQLGLGVALDGTRAAVSRSWLHRYGGHIDELVLRANAPESLWLEAPTRTGWTTLPVLLAAEFKSAGKEVRVSTVLNGGDADFEGTMFVCAPDVWEVWGTVPALLRHKERHPRSLKHVRSVQLYVGSPPAARMLQL